MLESRIEATLTVEGVESLAKAARILGAEDKDSLVVEEIKGESRLVWKHEHDET